MVVKIVPSSRPFATFRNVLAFVFNVSSCWPPDQPFELEDHPLSAVRDCFSPHLEAVSSVDNPKILHAVVSGTGMT